MVYVNLEEKNMSNSNNFYKSFMDNNFSNQTKSMFNMMNMNNIVSIANRNFGMATEIGRVVADNLQAMASHQIQKGQKFVKQSQEMMSNTNANYNLESGFDKNANFSKNMFDQFAENMREFAEQAHRSSTELFDLVATRMSENIAECTNCASDVVHNVANTVKKKTA